MPGLAGSYETRPYPLTYACKTSATCSDFVFLPANRLETSTYADIVTFKWLINVYILKTVAVCDADVRVRWI